MYFSSCPPYFIVSSCCPNFVGSYPVTISFVICLSSGPLGLTIVITPLLISNGSPYLYSVFGVVFNVIEVIGSSTDTVYVVVFVTPFSV